jgi:hypothetical protein
MAAARQAIGGESRIAAVKTLQVTGTFRRVIANNDTDGDLEVFLALPDRYLRSEKTGTPGQPSTETIEALVGTAMRDVVRGGGGRGGRGGRVGDVAGNPDGLAGGGGDTAQPADGGVDRGDDLGDVEGGDRGQGAGDNVATGSGRGRGGSGVDSETQRRARQAEVGRLWLMWLLRTEVPVMWIGIAESPDGKADVLETRLAGESTRLFLDAASHMPLMMTWQGAPGRAGGPGGRRGGDGQRGRGQGQPDAGAARSGTPQPMMFEMTFSDHRMVSGIRLPHVVTRGMNGQTIERWTIRSYRVNPSFTAETFTR